MGSPSLSDGSKAKGSRIVSTVFLALASVSVALVFVVTYLTANVTIPATKGYFDFGDIVIFIVALTFGPTIGGLAGGLGSSLSDALSAGSSIYAPFTLIIKGLEGYVAGYLAFRSFRGKLGIAWVFASAIMVGGYFVAESLVIVGYPASLFEVPFNVLQVVAGGVIGIPISQFLRRTLPSNMIYSRKPTQGNWPKS
ncbi:ECF transporter S component [Candidatus Bathyarchaeota archaeon]|nr:MAG: ECF transporter S component [Candidatus Bathyarchaeota archaeon]